MRKHHGNQKKTVEFVERSFLSEMKGGSGERAHLDLILQLWRDFAAEVDVSRSFKPVRWAAGLAYTMARLHLAKVSPNAVADWFCIRRGPVLSKYRTIAETLDLVLLDDRYVSAMQQVVIRRRYPSVPEGTPLLEAPTDLWRFAPLPSPEDLATERARSLTEAGWQRMGDQKSEQAQQYFHAALQHDDRFARAYNGLAYVAESRRNYERMEALFQKAYELSREALKDEPLDAHPWWPPPHARQYALARQGLARVYETTDCYEQAIEEFKALYRLGTLHRPTLCYTIASLYQRIDDPESALQVYRTFAERFPEHRGDPELTFCSGLALFQKGEERAGLDRWYEGIFENLYLVPLLVGEEPMEVASWHRTWAEGPEHAESYVNMHGPLWEHVPEALEVLQRLWEDPFVETARERWIEISEKLEVLAERARDGNADAAAKWKRLVDERDALQNRALDANVKDRVLGDSA